MRVKRMRVIDLPDEVIDAHAVELAPFSIALARVLVPEAQLLGSGTLVKYGKAHGILTARHVAEQLHTCPNVDIVLQKKLTLEEGMPSWESVFYHRPEFEITDAVIRLVNGT